MKSSKSVHLTLKVLLHYLVKYECLDSFRLKNCCGGIVRNVAYGGVSKVVWAERLYYRFVRSPLARIQTLADVMAGAKIPCAEIYNRVKATCGKHREVRDRTRRRLVAGGFNAASCDNADKT